MLTVYAICAVVGGLLILMSLLGGDHGTDHAEVSLDHDVSADAGHEGDLSHEGPWLPFLSLRFWSYGLAGFGVIGLILQLMGRVPLAMIPWIAGAFGLSLGLAIAWTLRQLSKNALNSGAGIDDLLGMEAEVTVPIRGMESGRIRATIKGDIIDMLAITDEPSALMPGSPVYIVSVEGDRVKVMSRTTLLEEGETVSVGT
jgi:membrane protein implicated in regulation of membrane protease activity